MSTIGDLLARDLSQRIEEIIKVDQTDEATVYNEISEYVATERLTGQYRDVLQAIADAPSDPHEGIGIWVSGFFGSGKSSFAKNLGYMLANPTLLGTPAVELYQARIEDDRTRTLLDFLPRSLPTEVIMFDVSVDRAVRQQTERLAEVMYRVLLRELDYAEDFDVAELEMELEQESKLDHFQAVCQDTYGMDWRMVRKGAQKISRASAILHHLEPTTYPEPDAWAQSLRGKTADITVATLVERAFSLCARRRPGKALVFIIDEVGQYVARSADKIEDLRAVVEEFGCVGRNLMMARKIVGPTWLIVTSQEKLDEVVAAIDAKRVQIAKLQDRFRHRVDMTPSDIREVATRRVLAKKPAAEAQLRALFGTCQGQLNAACRFERTSLPSQVRETEFVQYYPYLPHFVELSIDIMSGIRLQPGAPRHYGGSNRTIIKQTHEMLVNPRTHLAEKPVGDLVTLDRIYELVEGNLSTERQKDIGDIAGRFGGSDPAAAWPVRVAKTICLLEFVRDVPRTEVNLAACLVDSVSSHAPLREVTDALAVLRDAQFIRQTDEGWKLQTAQEKNWETERRSYLEPKPAERNDILRATLGDIFTERLPVYRYRNLRNFRVGIRVNGVSVGDEGQIPLSVYLAEDPAHYAATLAQVRDESRLPGNRESVYWTLALTSDIDDLVANLHASRQMVAKYDRERAQGRITSEEAACLEDEKSEIRRLQARLRERVATAIEQGHGLFRGVARDGASQGKSLPDILRAYLAHVVPDLYPNLVAVPLTGNEPEEVLRAANLSALSQVFYGGDRGLNLVAKQGANFAPNPSAETAKAVLDYLVHEHSYGNRDTRSGKALEAHFGGLGYGWERDLLRLVLAVLLRAGSIEVSHNGQRLDAYQDPQARVPLTNNVAFRSAIFTPVEVIDLKTLTHAVEAHEALVGKTVDVEKGAIATALKKWAGDEHAQLLNLRAQADAHHLPVGELLVDYDGRLKAILEGAADDCVRTLAGEGASLREARDRIHRAVAAIAGSGLLLIDQSRAALNTMWPALRRAGADGHLEGQALALQTALTASDFYEHTDTIAAASRAIGDAYGNAYRQAHGRRATACMQAMEALHGEADWMLLEQVERDAAERELVVRACQELELGAGASRCVRCGATLAQLESDYLAVPALRAAALTLMRERVAEKVGDETKPQRVRLNDYFGTSVRSADELDVALQHLSDDLHKYLDAGATLVFE